MDINAHHAKEKSTYAQQVIALYRKSAEESLLRKMNIDMNEGESYVDGANDKEEEKRKLTMALNKIKCNDENENPPNLRVDDTTLWRKINELRLDYGRVYRRYKGSGFNESKVWAAVNSEEEGKMSCNPAAVYYYCLRMKGWDLWGREGSVSKVPNGCTSIGAAEDLTIDW
eukprot:Nk52_evm1s1528 gene=Nk52_evmTU1s1528